MAQNLLYGDLNATTGDGTKMAEQKQKQRDLHATINYDIDKLRTGSVCKVVQGIENVIGLNKKALKMFAPSWANSAARPAKYGLRRGKDTVVERSIQDAYILAIRGADRFVYIENQYYLGSSFSWNSIDDLNDAKVKALLTIPKELSLKIASKIEKGEPFRVYVVFPRRTMQMMYTDIVQALTTKGIVANTKDYLTFSCLGNTEDKKPREYEPYDSPLPDSDYSRAQEARRAMIYVHSKMMIVDDEYIIVGSANINQRSMAGRGTRKLRWGRTSRTICGQRRSRRERKFTAFEGHRGTSTPGCSTIPSAVRKLGMC